MNNIATRDSWKNQPITNPKRIEINLKFNEDQFQTIKKGLIPHVMEDKWFIFFENDILYFHRSWTGYGVFKAKFTRENNEYIIKEFFAERNKDYYGNEDDNHDKNELILLIYLGLLKIDIRGWYAKLNESDETNALKMWADFGNMIFK